MAGKKLWISALAKDEQRIGKLNAALRRYGFDIAGHVWLDEPDKLAWRVAYDELQKRKTDCWLIMADAETLAKPTVRYALNLMVYAMRRDNKDVLPIIVLGHESLRTKLPTALQEVKIIDDAATSWEAKVVASTLKAPAAQTLPYRIDVYGDDKIGQWFEIGTTNENWAGVVFAVAGEGASVTFQAVGPEGKLPEKTTLQYAREGIKLQLGDVEFCGGSVRNELSAQDSYFARVKGLPTALLIIPDEGNAESDSAEAYVVSLN